MTDVEGRKDYVEDHCAVIGIQPSYLDSSNRYAVFENGKKTFYYDNKKSERSGTILRNLDDFPYYIQSSEYSEKITECIIDPSYANVKQRDLSNFFCGWKSLKSIHGIENLNTSKARNMESMFAICPNLESLDLSSFKTDNVISMGSMFSGCSSLTKLDISSFNTSNVTNMSSMFENCSSLESLNVSSFNTEKVTSMGIMFAGCKSLTSLDVGGFKTGNVTNMQNMFYECLNLKTIYASELWDMSNVEDTGEMFWGCSNLVGGTETKYDENHCNGEYAHVDGGPENPGYFTYKDIPDAIDAISPDLQTVRIYDLQGKRCDNIRKGLNIVVLSDGTVKKAVVK